MMKILKKDLELIEMAKQIVLSNCDIYENKALHVGCVVRAKSGKIYKGVNLKTSHSVCAEQVAIGQAFACGEREMDTIVAVKMYDDGEVGVTSPCGLCRYIFNKFNLNMNVIVLDKKGKILKVKAEELLPFPYKR